MPEVISEMKRHTDFEKFELLFFQVTSFTLTSFYSNKIPEETSPILDDFNDHLYIMFESPPLSVILL